MTTLLLFFSIYTITDSWWVFFTDKGIEPSSYYQIEKSLSLPLSSKALLRRERALGKGFDFDDLPLYQRYLDYLNTLGAKIRTYSPWLNGVSITADLSLIQELKDLPFVKEVRPVAVYKRREFKIPESKRAMMIEKRGKEDRYRDFYGPSYHQVAMLNVPKAYFKGNTGSGIIVGLLDTGFRKGHPALRDIRILKEHDFLGGDEFYLDGAKILSNISLAKDPLLFEDKDNTLHLFYVADTFYSNDVKRWLFWANSKNWTKSVPLSSGHSASSPTVCEISDGLCVAWDDCPSDERTHNINFYYSRDITVQNIGQGRFPHLTSLRDTLYIVYVSDGFSCVYQKGEKGPAGIEWGEKKVIASLKERIGSPQIIPFPEGEIGVLFYGLSSGKIYKSTSAIVDTLAGDFEIEREGDNLYLIYKDYSSFPYVALSHIKSKDRGKTWGKKRIISEKNLLSIGEFSLAIKGDTLLVAYETQGRIFVIKSDNGEKTWTAPEPIGQEEFTYLPQVLPSHTFWIRRGDDNTDYEPDEDHTQQPYHGTKMLSLIGGCDEGEVVGTAPGADFILAKTEKHIPALPDKYEFSVEEDTWIEGLEWVESSGADVVSSSLGYSDWYSPEDMDGKTSPASIAASLAAKRGLIIVNAVGNREGTQGPYMVAPADAEGVISCGGVCIDTLWKLGNPFPDSMWWDGSGFGPTSDGRMKPELLAPADMVYVANPIYVDNPDSLKSVLTGGTSCATALIAGVCALLLEAHPDWDANTLKDALFSTASNYRSLNDSLGYGVPNIDSALDYTPPPPPSPPSDYLCNSFPNPFILSKHDALYIPFYLLHKTWTKLRIFSLDGKLLREFKKPDTPLGFLSPGRYEEKNQNSSRAAFIWDGKTKQGKEVASGIYLLVLETGTSRDIKKVAIVR